MVLFLDTLHFKKRIFAKKCFTEGLFKEIDYPYILSHFSQVSISWRNPVILLDDVLIICNLFSLTKLLFSVYNFIWILHLLEIKQIEYTLYLIFYIFYF